MTDHNDRQLWRALLEIDDLQAEIVRLDARHKGDVEVVKASEACARKHQERADLLLSEVTVHKKAAFLAGWDFYNASRSRMDLPRDRIGAYNHWQATVSEGHDSLGDKIRNGPNLTEGDQG